MLQMPRRRTAQQVYDERYFTRFYDPQGGYAYERKEPWLSFFGTIADRIVKDIGARSALDAGCALGLLVEALRDRGVEAFGIDISEYAIANVREDMRPYCQLGSISDPFSRDYDLIITIETLEHMPPAEAERALDNICRHTSDVIFSSTPGHYRESTHVNVRPPEYWAELFARNGFYRDTEYDAGTYVSPWAARFRKAADIPRVVAGYERLQWRLRQELSDLRAAAIDGRDAIVKAEEQLAAAQRQSAAAEQRATAAEGRAEDVQRRLADRAASVTSEIDDIRGSRAYQIAVRLRTVARSAMPLETRRGRILDRITGRRRRNLD
jgi:SAM-dependent methyltransferase